MDLVLKQIKELAEESDRSGNDIGSHTNEESVDDNSQEYESNRKRY